MLLHRDLPVEVEVIKHSAIGIDASDAGKLGALFGGAGQDKGLTESAVTGRYAGWELNTGGTIGQVVTQPPRSMLTPVGIPSVDGGATLCRA